MHAKIATKTLARRECRLSNERQQARLLNRRDPPPRPPCRPLSHTHTHTHTQIHTHANTSTHCAPTQRRLEGHVADVDTCRFFPSGKVILSADLAIKYVCLRVRVCVCVWVCCATCPCILSISRHPKVLNLAGGSCFGRAMSALREYARSASRRWLPLFNLHAPMLRN